MVKLILRLVLRPIYGVRAGIKPPTGPPPAWSGHRWSLRRRAAYRVRVAWFNAVSRAYRYSGLPARWEAWRVVAYKEASQRIIAAHTTEAPADLAREEDEYIARGICRDCGACSLSDAARKCKPREVGCTGDYSCAGEKLWEGQEP